MATDEGPKFNTPSLWKFLLMPPSSVIRLKLPHAKFYDTGQTTGSHPFAQAVERDTKGMAAPNPAVWKRGITGPGLVTSRSTDLVKEGLLVVQTSVILTLHILTCYKYAPIARYKKKKAFLKVRMILPKQKLVINAVMFGSDKRTLPQQLECEMFNKREIFGI